ncbi:MAG: SH3 domain-containing protein [Bacteroidales bacterium]|nr:SH3 domain-containing protein [Bacteroidales bacterium]
MNKRVSSAVLTVILFIFSLLFSNVVSAVPVGIGDYVYSCGYDGFVNMRQEPSYSAGKVGKFYNGERAKVVGERGEDWKQVEVGSSVGWVPVKYIQTAPTLAYTGNVDVNWVEGIWDYNGSILMVFDNGTFVWGYDDETSHGVYIMQNNEIRFIPTWTEETLAGFDETLEINERSNMLGDYSRQHYLSQEDADEGYGGFGCLTRQEFKSFGKRLLAEVDREKVFNIYALKESAREEVQEAEEIEEAEETGGRSSDRDHSALFSWMWRILEILVGLALIALLMWGIMRLGRFLKEKKA